MSKKIKVGFISLGCNKNLVDTEMMIGLFKQRKYEIVNDPSRAEVIVINTCGFIEPAKEEAINTILEMAEYKKKGKCKFLIATGCLVERYKEDLEKSIPEVDMYIKFSDYYKDKETAIKTFNELFSKLEKKEVKDNKALDYLNREISTGKNFAYIKIAEGCDNRCTYCAIPNIRGRFKSRPMEDIIAEAKDLAKKGYTEIILTAQDTSKYGIDLYNELKLSNLLEELCKINKIKRLRFLYTYPETITDDLIRVVKENDKICKYFDIPIQHASDKILKRMNRKSNKQSIEKTLKKLRENIPGVVIRTTLIVGFPGETEEDFDELYNFVKENKFDKLGVFTYSKEEGTPAAIFKDQIHPSTKRARLNKIMNLQKEIIEENRKNLLGKEIDVLVEDIDDIYYVGRSYMDSPDVDGCTYVLNSVNKKDENKINDEDILNKYVKCKIIDIDSYDIYCEMI